MFKRNWMLYVCGACTACGVLWWVIPGIALAQYESGRPQGNEPKEVTLTGRIVDLQCHMTENWPSEDRKRCTTDCLRSGVPSALEVGKQLYVLGHGMKNPNDKVLPFAYQEVEVTGKVYEKQGVKYLNVEQVKPAGQDMHEDVDEMWDEEEE